MITNVESIMTKRIDKFLAETSSISYNPLDTALNNSFENASSSKGNINQILDSRVLFLPSASLFVSVSFFGSALFDL